MDQVSAVRQVCEKNLANGKYVIMGIDRFEKGDMT